MRNLFSLACCLLLTVVGTTFASAPSTEKAKIKWQTNYEAALQQAKNTSKPIILFFTGSDWCGWCTKLDEEALNTADFNDAVADKFVFVRLDFPLYSSQDAQLTAQNKQLQKKYEVRSFPTIVMINTQEKQIGTTGYRPGGGKQYADHLFKMQHDYESYQQKVSKIDQEKLSGKDLKKLYEKAREYHLEKDAQTIIAAGSDSEHAVYFLTERYRQIAELGQTKTDKAIALKEKLLQADANNEYLTHYKVAIIDFEANCEEVHNNDLPVQTAIKPLQDYISAFGGKDKENNWRLEMIISQVFLEKNELPEALKHAQASYNSAPASAKEEIAQAIKSIEKHISQ